jgi:hypothetical protein
MSWPKWVLIALYVFTALANVASVGKERKPLSPGVATASLVVTGILVVLVVLA